MSRFVTLPEAAAAVPDGALLTFGGFQLNRAPMALTRELVRQGRRGLRVVTTPNPLPLDLLAAAGALGEAEFGFLGFQYEDGFVVAPAMRRAIEGGTLAWRERDVYEIVQALRAAALGLPFLPAPGAEGSDYRRVNRTPLVRDPERGEEILAVAAIRPDILLVHAQAADEAGNLLITDPYAETLQARAAGRVVATAERRVAAIERPTIVGSKVDRVAVVPGGAFPASCHRHYPHAPAHVREYVALLSGGRAAEYLERFVNGPADHAAFLRAAGGPGTWETPARAGSARPASAPAGTVPAASGSDPVPAADQLVVNLARCIADGDVVATGVASALPMLAIALAKATHAPRAVYLNCVGAIDPVLDAASPTSVDVRLLDRCAATLSLPDMFDMARRGEIDLMFFGGSQVDREARLNMTCIGDYARPRVKLPGPAGSSSMRPFVRTVVIALPRHSTRTLVDRVDFATSVASPRNRETTLVSDLAVLALRDGRLRLRSRHAGVTGEAIRDRTSFALEEDGPGGRAGTTPGPTAVEMDALRRLDPGGLRFRMV